jgi:nitrite reductase (NADH) large subunit
MSYVIIGASAAGIAACEAIRSLDPESPITVISDEKHGPYSRCLISYYLAGEMEKEAIRFREKDFYQKNMITALAGKKAVRLDTENKKVILENGEEIPYRKLLLATGGTPKFPDIPGVEAKNVLGMRTLDDAEKLLALSGKTKQAVILGGGLIGCKAAYGLRERGLEVTIAIGSNRVLSQMLDLGAADIFRRRFEEHGIAIMTGKNAQEIIIEKGRATGVKLDSGETLPAQMVVIGKGVVPRMELAEGTSIETDYGILADEHLMTSAPDIYAAGDVAQAPDLLGGEKVVNALWPVATEQGRIAGYNMAGGEKIYPGSLGMNSIGFYGLNVIAAGKVSRLSDGQEAIVQDLSHKNIYKKLVVENDRPIGLILVGEIKSAGVIISLIKKGADVSRLKDIILERNFGYGRIARTAGVVDKSDFPAVELLS